MKLSTWIDKNGGTAQTGAILGVARNCVYAWREGVALPRPHLMRLIVEKTKGRVSYAEMIGEHLQKKFVADRDKRRGDVRQKKKQPKLLKNGKPDMRGQNSGPAKAKRLIEHVVKMRKQVAKKKASPLGF